MSAVFGIDNYIDIDDIDFGNIRPGHARDMVAALRIWLYDNSVFRQDCPLNITRASHRPK
jgi:hypothetical protein